MDLYLVELAEAAIRRHLEARPRSADTLRGIHDWWIDGHAHISYTEYALLRLEVSGFVERVANASGALWRRREPGAEE